MESYIVVVAILYAFIMNFLKQKFSKEPTYDGEDIRELSPEEYIILKNNSKEKDSQIIKYYGYKLYVYQYLHSLEGVLGTFLAKKEADFYKLDKIEKMIYSYFVGSPKRIRFAAGDVNIRYEVNKKILNIKRKMLDEGLIIGKFNPKILLGYFFRLVLLTILEALVIFIYLIPFEMNGGVITPFYAFLIYPKLELRILIIHIVLSIVAIVMYMPNYVTSKGLYYMAEFEKERPDTIIRDEKFIFQEPEKNLKRYLVSRMDFLRILGNW